MDVAVCHVGPGRKGGEGSGFRVQRRPECACGRLVRLAVAATRCFFGPEERHRVAATAKGGSLLRSRDWIVATTGRVPLDCGDAHHRRGVSWTPPAPAGGGCDPAGHRPGE